MEKHYFTIRTLLLLYLSAMFAAASAQQVSQDEAARIASQFLSAQNQGSRAKKAAPDALKLVYTESSAKDKTPNLYVFNMEGGGFAIVSADERTGSQILGYSFDNNFSAKGMPDNVKFWLGEYSRQIDYIKTHQPEVSESKRRGGLKKDSGTLPASVGPLLETQWGQWNGIGDEDCDGVYQTLFNNYLPTGENEDGYTDHYAVGCVATAMAQILYYHAKTKQPNSTITFLDHAELSGQIQAPYDDASYAWSDMKTYYGWEEYAAGDEENGYTIDADKVSKDQDAIDAVAELMFDCAVATKTQLGIESNADEYGFIRGMCDNYGFSSNMKLVSKHDYMNNEWLEMMKTELAAGRPVYYGAGDTNDNNSGHAFIVDGYDENNYLHINWGWRGESDGYFKLNEFNIYDPDGDADYDEYYNADQLAIINIYKPTEPEARIDWNDADIIAGWDDDNWVYFGYGIWDDEYTSKLIDGYLEYLGSCELDVYIRTNTEYPNYRQIKIEKWNDRLDDVIIYGKEGDWTVNDQYDLIINWDMETNQCNIETSYSKTTTSYTPLGGIYPIVLWVIDETDYKALEKGEDYSNIKAYDGYYDPDQAEFKLRMRCKGEPTGLYDDDRISTTLYSFNQLVDATLTMKGGLYLDDFDEETDKNKDDYGTAIQKAGMILPMRNKLYYRTGIMPVTENTTSSDVYKFAKGLNDNSTTGLNNVPGTLIVPTDDTGDHYNLNQFKINEGAYYVVAAYYDETGDTYYYYQYLPVFFSMNEKWGLVGMNCIYWDDLVGGLYGNTVGASKQEVEVQQYKGGNLIKNVGDRIFRIKNPYGALFSEHDLEEGGDMDINEEAPYRTDVYLCLYVDADNNVSIYPEYFNLQPLGIDWGCGEMMITQSSIGEFDPDNNLIKFDDAMYAIEYYDAPVYDVNTDANKFLLQLPQDLKYYLTLVDNQPYTDDEGSTNYYKGAYYSRSLTNNWGTLMLPYDFDTSKLDGFSFYQLSGLETDAHGQTTSLKFSKYQGEDDIVPENTPVIFKRTDTSKNLEVFEEKSEGSMEIASCNDINQKSNTTVDNWSFIGVYDPHANDNELGAITGDELAYCFFFEDNMIKNVNLQMNLYQYRAYFKTKDENAAKQIRVILDDEEYTSLDALFNGEQPVKKYGKGRFNLQGQAVGKNYKGVVIEDGRKKLRF